MKRIGLFVVSMVLAMNLVACGPGLGKEAFEKGLAALEDRDYGKVLISFEIAREEGFESEEMEKIGSIIEGYSRAEELNKDGSYEEAMEALEKVNPSYVDYPIKEDIIGLRSELQSNIQAEKIDNILEGMETSLGDGKLEEVEKVRREVEGLELNENQNKKLEEIVAGSEKVAGEIKFEDGVIGTTNPTSNPNKPTFKKYSQDYYRNETREQREQRVQEKKDEKRRFIQEKKNRYH